MNTEAASQGAAAVTASAEKATYYLDKDLSHWTHFLLALAIAYAIGKIAGMVMNLSSKRTARRGHPAMAATLLATGRTLGPFSLVLGLYIGQRFLDIPEAFHGIAHVATALLFTMVGGLYAWRLVEVATAAFEDYASKTEGKMDDMLVPIIRTGLRALVVVLFVVQVVQTISHEQLSSVIAGLGIGGLAFALAAQDSIKNVFGSVVIIADKPFVIDERIKVDGFDGIVEEVGLRSTRIRTFDGSVVTIPNGEMANKTIENVGRRRNIRRVLNVTITYDMTPAQVAQARGIINDILAVPPMQGGRTEGASVRDAAFMPRVYFNDFNDSSLNIQVIYWYDSTNYWDYMAYTEWFNFELLRRFNESGIDMAYPTQTLYLAGDPKRPLDIGQRLPAKGNS